MTVQTQSLADQVRSRFNFSVDKFPLSGPDSMKTPFYGLFRSDNSASVGSSSVMGGYTVHTTDDVVALVEAAQDAFGDESKLDCHFSDGHYVNLMPSDCQRVEICQNDGIFPRLLIKAGYDKQAFTATVGFFRDMCSNLSMIRSVNSTSVKIRHSSGLRDKMNELIAQFQNLRGSWDDLVIAARGMNEVDVNMATFTASVMGVEPGDEVSTRKQNIIAAIFRRVQDERRRSGRIVPSEADDFQVSAWEAFNAVQGYYQHDSSRKGTLTPFDRIIKANDDGIVKKAERLAYAAIAA